jgi:hypothetical protein
VTFIRGAQNLDGGFPSQPGGESNAQSSAWAIQGLLAAGADPGSLHRRGAISPLRYLRSLIASDGHVRYSRSTDHTPVWVTAQALMALQRRALPISPVPRSRHARARTATAGPAGGVSPASAGSAAGASVRSASARARRSGARTARARAARGRAPSAGAAGSLARLAADAGLLSALAFAPVGLS